jgi:hypothetical protein
MAFRDPNYLYFEVNVKFSFVRSTILGLHGAMEAELHAFLSQT